MKNVFKCQNRDLFRVHNKLFQEMKQQPEREQQ